MKKWKKYMLEVNGFEVEAVYNEDTINSVFIPLLEKLTSIQKCKNRRILVFLVAPPAVGKTTLSLFLQSLSEKYDDLTNVQALGLDGFHYSSAYIENHTIFKDGKEISMKEVKGCPETFDLEKLTNKLYKLLSENIKWPVYDRNKHDVIEDAITVSKDIIILEGNWLLLKDLKWRELKNICDFSVMVVANEEKLKDRLINRKVKGGLSKEEAVLFYENSDKENVRRVLKDSTQADMTLIVDEDGDYRLI